MPLRALTDEVVDAIWRRTQDGGRVAPMTHAEILKAVEWHDKGYTHTEILTRLWGVRWTAAQRITQQRRLRETLHAAAELGVIRRCYQREG